MRILLTNDDGYFAPGILAFAKETRKRGHEVVIFAPDKENSAKSHSITILEPPHVKKVEIEDFEAYSVSGTPADCVRAAIEVKGHNFDFVFSGCNLGLNSGMDILYSGTVSAAVEANILGIPSLALSAQYKHGNCNFQTAVYYGLEVFEKIKNLKEAKLVNVNTPKLEINKVKGIKVASVGGSITDKFKKTVKGDTIKIEVVGRDAQNDIETDRTYLEDGYVTVTPLIYDFTNLRELKNFKEIFR